MENTGPSDLGLRPVRPLWGTLTRVPTRSGHRAISWAQSVGTATAGCAEGSEAQARCSQVEPRVTSLGAGKASLTHLFMKHHKLLPGAEGGL